ncbi:sensor domain-containing protein [Mycolicibacterium sp. 22603]|uniref:sensor domain-containing protein n=1 Tax=Mycolicibacterium sp. 22603 TaxID=3453950 RepID=UPI003F870A0C
MSGGGFGAWPGGSTDGDPFGADPFGAPTSTSVGGYAGVPPPPSGSDPTVNTLATLSVIFAFVFAPAGAVLGHLGLVQIGRTGQRGHTRAVIGLALSYTVIIASVATIVFWTVTGADSTDAAAGSPTVAAPASSSVSPVPTTTTPPPAPLVEAAALPGLLLTDAEARILTGDNGLSNLETLTEPQMPPTTESVYEPLECVPSFLASTTVAYGASGHLGFYGTAPGNAETLLSIGQSVSNYTDAATATGMLDYYRGMWTRCAGTTLLWHMMQDRATGPITLGAPRDAGDGVIELVSHSTLDNIPYQRAIAAKNNVLVDIQVSGGDQKPGTAIDVAKMILSKIPG